MIRATTPKQVFIFDKDPELFEKILITYSQNDKIILEKQKSDLTLEEIRNPSNKLEGYSVWFRMTQEEANLFLSGPGKQAVVQVRVKSKNGEVLASEKKTFSVQDVLNDVVI